MSVHTAFRRCRLRVENARIQAERERLLEQMKSFMQMVSHDLRTPLTIINGHACLMQELMADGDMVLAQQSAESIERGVMQMNAMIDDLVESARLESGQLTMKLHPLTLPAYLPAFVSRNAGALQTERIILDVPADLAPVMADDGRLDPHPDESAHQCTKICDAMYPDPRAGAAIRARGYHQRARSSKRYPCRRISRTSLSASIAPKANAGRKASGWACISPGCCGSPRKGMSGWKAKWGRGARFHLACRWDEITSGSTGARSSPARYRVAPSRYIKYDEL